MSKLDIDFEALQKSKQCKVRLTADPLVGPRELAKAINNFCLARKSTELWSLIAPPASAPQKFGFKTLPHLDWLIKMLPLLYELVELTPSTKVLSKTLVKALRILHCDKNVTIGHNQDFEDVVDKCDVAIRMHLWWLRSIKTSPDLLAKLSRQCNTAEKMKLDMVLKKIQLPQEYCDDDEVGSCSAIASPREDSQEERKPAEATASACQSFSLVPFCNPVRNIALSSSTSVSNMTVSLAVQIFSSINKGMETEDTHTRSQPLTRSFRDPILLEALNYQATKTTAVPTKASKSKAAQKCGVKRVQQPEQKSKVNL